MTRTMGEAGGGRDVDVAALGRRAVGPEAWKELVRRFAPYVHAVAAGAYRLPEEEAKEVFEEVFEALCLRRDTLGDDAGLRAWIAGLTRSLAAERTRSEPPAPEVLARLDDALEVREATRRLPSAQRRILQLVYEEGSDLATTATVMGMSAGSVADQLRRARHQLRLQLRMDRRRTVPEAGQP